MATLSVGANRDFVLHLNFHLAAFLLGEPQGHLTGPARARWAALADQDLRDLSARAEAYLAQRVELDADGAPAAFEAVAFPSPDDLRADGLVRQEEARASAPVVLTGRLPAGTQSLTLAAPLDFTQTLFVVEIDGAPRAGHLLGQGERSPPVMLQAGQARAPPLGETVVHYGRLGFEHIVPKGIDHILFVLGLFLLTPQWRALAAQVTLFTLAHSVTLALAVFDLVAVPSVVVEPLIAASIVAVAADNLWSRTLRHWRMVAVFAFGLLHGLGFAGILSQLGLPPQGEALALIAFNVGVEAGQIAVLAAAFLAVGWMRDAEWFRPRIAQPASLVIAAIGALWLIERVVTYA